MVFYAYYINLYQFVYVYIKLLIIVKVQYEKSNDNLLTHLIYGYTVLGIGFFKDKYK